jgi:hypothetical protein
MYRGKELLLGHYALTALCSSQGTTPLELDGNPLGTQLEPLGIASSKPRWKILGSSESMSVLCIDHIKFLAGAIFNLG